MSIFKSTQKIITRIAPSPTGEMHIGTVRTALFNYLFAKKYGGSYFVRIEDTDKERNKEEWVDAIWRDFEWFGLTPDARYRTSEHLDRHRELLHTLVNSGKAYVSKEPKKDDPSQTVEVVRLHNPGTLITFDDLIRGEVTFDTTELGDFVIARSIDDPLYHFAVVVDDGDAGVTHVLRAEEHISNTPRQILILEALGFERPKYGHMPLILAPDRSKLSKRKHGASVSKYREQGFLASALINYLALLGWNPGTDQEFFTLRNLVDTFDLSGVQKGGAMFDIEKLKWFNQEHLKRMSTDDFASYIHSAISPIILDLSQYSNERFMRLLPTIRERVATNREAFEEAEKGEYDFAFSAPQPDSEMLKWKNDTTSRESLPRLQKLAEILAQLPEKSTIPEVKDAIWDYATEVGKGEVLWPLRVALTGRERSPDPFTIIHIIGSGEAYKRINTACDTILRAS